jgi:hypothetical protein
MQLALADSDFEFRVLQGGCSLPKNSPLGMTSLPTKLVRHLQIGSGASDAGARVLVAVCVVYMCVMARVVGACGRSEYRFSWEPI